MGLFDFIFGNKTKKVQEFKDRGAVLLDVRSKLEYKAGAIKGAKNIPLEQVSRRMSEIQKWGKPVICYCRSGMRSGTATSILKRHGIEAMNGGGWQRLNERLSE